MINLQGGRTGAMKNPGSEMASATGRLPGAPNIQDTTRRMGGRYDGSDRWATNFRIQNTPQMQSPFNPDFDDPLAGMTPNGAGGGSNFYNMMMSGGMPPTVPGQTPPGSVVSPVGPTQAQNPFQSTTNQNYQNALGSLDTLNQQGGQTVPPPVQETQGPSQQEIDANQRYLQQAFEFMNNPQYRFPDRTYDRVRKGGERLTHDEIVDSLNNGGSWALATMTRRPGDDSWGARQLYGNYWGNPYLSNDMLQASYDRQMDAWRTAATPEDFSGGA